MSSLGKIFRQHGREYLALYGSPVPSEHRVAIHLLGACRSGDLGSTHWHCQSCHRPHRTPRSCGNRHCPACQAQKNDRWLEEQSGKRLDAPYFLLTFTLPGNLRRFVRSHQRVCYSALVRAASAALEKLARDPRFLGAGRLGFTAVLHTWGRQLSYHLHLLVPAGGVSPGGEWVSSRTDFLVPVKALSKIFRAKFRREMERSN